MNRFLHTKTAPWYAPVGFRGWYQRLISPRAIILLLILTVLVATESRFDWIEHTLGSYLVTTNPHRPKSGAGWEIGLQADQARQTLSEVSAQRQNSQLEAQRSTSLGQVVAGIQGEKGIIISADHFVELYLKLPPAISHEIITPYALLASLSTGRWQRTFFERQAGQVRLSLLDAQNQVLRRLDIGADLLAYVEQGEVAVQTGLDAMADFADYIYPAENFFYVLNTLSESMRARIMPNPEDLLRVSGRIHRVGISNMPQAGAVDLGFEVDDIDGPKVILMQGRFEDVWRLQSALEGRFPIKAQTVGESGP